MRRHIVSGRFGPADRPTVQVQKGQVLTQINLAKSNRHLCYGIGNALEDLAMLRVLPTEIGLDLLVFAAHVHAADTRISRLTESQDSWTREIHLVVPVSDPHLWGSTASLLKRTLDFLTGDQWAITFRARPRSFAAIVPPRPKHWTTPQYDDLMLFSGGLDSLIGAIDMLEANGRPLLVSHVGDVATSRAQNLCFKALEKHYKNTAPSHLRLRMSFPTELVHGINSESTTRGRSFLFFATGIFAGTGLSREFRLLAPENGLIALNVPLDQLRLGALSTRTMHPFYLARWNELLDLLGIPGRIENPYWEKTKGEMVAGCANGKLLQKLVPASLSCSSPTKGRWKKRGIEHCGHCLPCIIRRAALKASLDPGPDPTAYTLSELVGRVLNTLQAEGREVRSFQLAIKRLRANPGLSRLLIHKPGPLSDVTPAGLAALASVYQRGMSEVAALLAEAKTQPD